MQRAVRAALGHTETESPRATVERIAAVANEYGLTVPKPPVPLPPANLDDIYLVCWTAIFPDPDLIPGNLFNEHRTALTDKGARVEEAP